MDPNWAAPVQLRGKVAPVHAFRQLVGSQI
jgi:hypothetical protein